MMDLQQPDPRARALLAPGNDQTDTDKLERVTRRWRWPS